MVKINPLDSRKGKDAISAPSSDGILRIVTKNLDIPAEIVAALYLLRWTIEIYLAIIACIMIMSITGLATCQIPDANSAGKHAANLAFDDKAKTVPNTIGWKSIPRATSNHTNLGSTEPSQTRSMASEPVRG